MGKDSIGKKHRPHRDKKHAFRKPMRNGEKGGNPTPETKEKKGINIKLCRTTRKVVGRRFFIVGKRNGLLKTPELLTKKPTYQQFCHF